MFSKLFTAGGLSFDRLRVLLEVSASGSIAKAANGDPVKQSQYSRQIKELEDFFETKLIERHGKGVRLTDNGRELARIGRFFLLGLSNFQGGCLRDEQMFRVAASPTVIERFLMPVLSERSAWEGTCVLSLRVWRTRSEEHTSELQSQSNLVCRLLLEKKKK